MPGIVGRLIAPELALVLANHNTILFDDDAVRIRMHIDRAANSTRLDRVFVAVKAHEAGLGDGRTRRMEAVEDATIGHQQRPFGLEHLEHRPVLLLRVRLLLGIGDAFVQQPAVEILKALEGRAWCKEALPDNADLVLDLTFFPASGRCARCWFNQVMAHHLLKAPVELALLANEHGVHCRLHVVVDTPSGGAPEERERPFMRVKHHLLSLAQIGPDEQHPAMAQPHLRQLYRYRHAVEDRYLVAPVELEGLASGKAQRHERRRHPLALAGLPGPAIAANRIIAARKAAKLQFLEHPLVGQPLAPGHLDVGCQQPLQRPDMRRKHR